MGGVEGAVNTDTQKSIQTPRPRLNPTPRDDLCVLTYHGYGPDPGHDSEGDRSGHPYDRASCTSDRGG